MVIPFAGYRGQGHRGGTPLALRGVPVAIVPHRENDIIPAPSEFLILELGLVIHHALSRHILY